tara:strand:+ start:1796 stop:3112 length:1317 start_codon:yes stop_codon:yes gene_type:complete
MYTHYLFYVTNKRKMLSTESANESFFIDKRPYDECPICFEIVKETDRTVLKCGHVFHSSCFMENVLQSNNTCCLCRTEVSRKAIQLPDLNKETILNFIESNIVINKPLIRKCLIDLFNNSSSISEWNELSKKKKTKKVNIFMNFIVEYGIGMGKSISKWIEAGNDRMNFDSEDETLFTIDVQSILEGDNESESESESETDENNNEIIKLVDESVTQQMFASFPKSLTVSGRVGEFEEYMGIYIREEGKIVRNAPLYTMIVPSSEIQSEKKIFLFKGEKGNWMLGDEEQDISSSLGGISGSERDIEYPNNPDLHFEYAGDVSWVFDPFVKIYSNDDEEDEEESAEGIGYPLFYDYMYHNEQEFICDNVREFLQHYHLSHFQSRVSRNNYLLDIDNFLSADIETFMWPEGGSGIRPLFTRDESETIMNSIIEYFSQFHLD